MNNDRIADLYEGRMGDAEAQQLARRRVQWMCARASGQRVLDLGCSQGIAAILLGREGREVVGIDRETAAIDAARERLASEIETVQSRVRFEVAEASSMPFEDASFDTVLLGEVLEHQTSPEEMLGYVDRVLRPGGTVVVTVPYGLFRYHDHKTTIYLGPLLEGLSRRWDVGALELMGRYLGAAAVKPAFRHLDRPGGVPWREALALADRRVAQHDGTVDEQQRELSRLRRQIQALEAERDEIARMRAELEAANERARAARRELEEIAHSERTLRSELDIVRLNLARAEAERDEALRRTASDDAGAGAGAGAVTAG